MPTKGKRICKHRKNTSITRRSPSYSPDDNASSSDEKPRSPDEVNHKAYSREHSTPQEDYASDDYSSSDEEYNQKYPLRKMRELLNHWEKLHKKHPRKKRNRINNPKKECSRMLRKRKSSRASSKAHSPQRKHKKRRKHSSSSYSSHSDHGHTHKRITQTPHRVNPKDVPMKRRKRNNHAFTIQKEERWITLSHAVGKKASSPPTAQMLCDCIRTVLLKGGFAAIPHLRSMSQIDMLHRPHSSKDRATQCVLRLPPPKGSARAKSCGSITFYSTRWGVATTEGNVMINANPSITRCVRTALEATCKEITFPLGTSSRAPPSHPHPATLHPAPTNINDAIDQCVAFLGPEQAAIIVAMKPSTDAPGEAAATQELLTTLLQTKSSSSSKYPSSHKR